MSKAAASLSIPVPTPRSAAVAVVRPLAAEIGPDSPKERAIRRAAESFRRADMPELASDFASQMRRATDADEAESVSLECAARAVRVIRAEAKKTKRNEAGSRGG